MLLACRETEGHRLQHMLAEKSNTGVTGEQAGHIQLMKCPAMPSLAGQSCMKLTVMNVMNQVSPACVLCLQSAIASRHLQVSGVVHHGCDRAMLATCASALCCHCF